ncbi:MAG TPA: TetR/AcrR family transcriptional regulator [Anaerolineales bacterium]|nr:TetR/AcrR family transcriptional regulator [Anaerolineales bacterium]
MKNDEILSKGERTRQAILQAAYELFLENGYAATSVRQIADRTGLALGGIYNHFANKEAIFSELIIDRHPFHQILPLLQAAPGNTVEEFVRNAARSMVTELGRRPDFIRLLFIELVEFNGRDFPGMFKVVFPQILPLIQRFQDRQDTLRPIPPFILFRAFLGLFFSYYMTEFLLTGVPVPAAKENALDHFVDIFLHGVMVESTEKYPNRLSA